MTYTAPPNARVDVELILQLTREGMTCAEVAAIVGCNERTVTRWRVRSGHVSPKPFMGRRYTPEELATYETCLDEGWSFREITRTYGVDKDTLARHFPGRGWTRTQTGELVGAMRHFAAESKRWAVNPQAPHTGQPCRAGQPKSTPPAQSPTNALQAA